MNTKDIRPDTFNLNEASIASGINRIRLAQLARTPGFPAFKCGRRWIIPREAFLRWLEEQAGEQARL